MKTILLWNYFFLFTCLVLNTAQAQTLKVSVSDPQFQPYAIAVPSPTLSIPDQAAQKDTQIALEKLLQWDVEASRHLMLVPPKSYLVSQDANKIESLAVPIYKNWQTVGARGLIKAHVSGIGQLLGAELYFYDVTEEKKIIQQHCRFNQEPVPNCVHRFLDSIILHLTGERGIFSSKLIFVRQQEKSKTLFVADWDGSHYREVVRNKSLNLLPHWAPHENSILYTSFISGNPMMYRLDLTRQKTTPLLNHSALNMGGVVSPDGKYIAFTLSKHGNADIYIMPYDGNRPTQLTRSWGQDVSPTFSPDGQEIAFVSSRSGNPHIYVMDIHGKNQRRITFQGKYNQEPSWSPVDAEQIVFTARDEKLIYDIFTVNPQNSFIQRLTQDAGNNDAPSFSPDGSSIVFTSDRESKKYQRSIWIMDVDGTGQRPLPLPPGHYENPQWGPRRLRYD